MTLVAIEILIAAAVLLIPLAGIRDQLKRIADALGRGDDE